MNAKKIMGAVLVALLAAALFVGAGAAADKGTFFVYQTGTTLENGVWVSGSSSITVDSTDIIAANNFVPGTYKYNGNSAYITYPSATIAGIANPTDLATAYNFIGATLYKGDSVSVTATAVVSPDKYLLTYPNGSTLVYDNVDTIVPALPKGTYKLAVNFSVSNFVPGTLIDLLVSEPVSFTVADADDAIAMLPQPYVTTVMMNNDKVRIALDVTKEWESLTNGDSSVVTGVIVAQKSFVEENKAAVDAFLAEYAESTLYANEQTEAAAELVEKYDISPDLLKIGITESACEYWFNKIENKR